MPDLPYFQSVLPQLLAGARVTIEFTILSAIMGTVLGLIFALMRISSSKLLVAVATAYVEFFRGTPLLVQIFIIAFGIAPIFGIPDYFSAVAALSINSGAYTAEIFRAGILSIPKGQMEAGRSLGLNYAQAMWYIIIPQAFRFCIPPLGNEFIALLKDSSLVSIIAITDLMRAGREITGRTIRPFETYTIVAFLYLAMTLPLTLLVRYLERRTKTG